MMEDRRNNLVVSKKDLREVFAEIIEQTDTNHFCHLSKEERHALKELSQFLKRVDNTKWALGVALLIGTAVFLGGALWVGIKQLVRVQQ